MSAAVHPVARTERPAVAPPDRASFLGGSDIAAMLGLSPWKDEFGLYLEKTGELPPHAGESKQMRRGKILEPAIIELYRSDYEVNIETGVTMDIPGCDFGRAQIDAIEHVPGGAMIPVEVKSASEFTAGKWGKSGTDDAPTYYCTQLHWQMLATGAPFGRIVALLGADDLRVYTIERDEGINTFLLTSALAFWDAVIARKPPDINFSHASTLATLERLYRQPDAKEVVFASPLLQAYRMVYQDAVEQCATFERIRESARARLLAGMGNAGVLDFGDDYVFTRKWVKRRGYAVADTTYIDGRLKKKAAPKADPDAPALQLTEGTTDEQQ